MNDHGAQLSARAISDLLAKIFGPSFYDGPRFGHNPLLGEFAGAFLSQRRNQVELNPQPEPPGDAYAMAIADAYIGEIIFLDRISVSFGEEVAQRALNQSVRQLADLDELCPRWPTLPKVWPPPPPPPWQLQDEMQGTQLLLFGSRFLAAANVVKQERVQDAMVQLGEKALLLSTESRSYSPLQKAV